MENKYSIVEQEMYFGAKFFVEESIPKDQQSDGNGTRRFAYLRTSFLDEKDAQEYINFKNIKVKKHLEEKLLNYIRYVDKDSVENPDEAIEIISNLTTVD